ncbi:MAG TPA: hypothetical protein VEC59_00650, partial [Steroidobacteraceae bacterium]|nr:hypothetical protein [Steroidobacteraceae bacterium]
FAYRKGDYERALHDYRELAELGQPTAQFNLAIMYTKGQGTPQSDINAYAWATLAAEGGEAHAQALADELRPLLAPGSEKIANDIAAPFRREELDARLMPKIEDTSREACGKFTAPRMGYPPGVGWNVQGNVFAEFVVLPDGRARHARILYGVPVGVFEGTVREAVLHLQFAVRAPDSAPAHCSVMFRFAALGQDASDYPGLRAFVSKTRVKAEAGDVPSEEMYGMLLEGFPQLGRGARDALPWFLKAAQAGAPTAQYEVGSSLLHGIGCRCEATKGEVWLRKAAEADQPDAQVTLAQYALRGSPDTAATEQAKLWLERAVKSGNHDGMLYLSALLAATPVNSLRDPARALHLLEGVKGDLRGDPAEFEIRAAAEASAGDFAQAVKSEREAIDRAAKLHWDLSSLRERLASYQNQKPWFGSLLAL